MQRKRCMISALRATYKSIHREVRIAHAGFFEPCLRAPKLLVLHLQLDLVDSKLMDQLAHILAGAFDGSVFLGL